MYYSPEHSVITACFLLLISKQQQITESRGMNNFIYKINCKKLIANIDILLVVIYGTPERTELFKTIVNLFPLFPPLLISFLEIQ